MLTTKLYFSMCEKCDKATECKRLDSSDCKEFGVAVSTNFMTDTKMNNVSREMSYETAA